MTSKQQTKTFQALLKTDLTNSCNKNIHTSAALLPVLGPRRSKTLGLRDGAAGLLVPLVAGLLVLLVAGLLLLSDMVFEFSTVTFRLILDIL